MYMEVATSVMFADYAKDMQSVVFLTYTAKESAVRRRPAGAARLGRSNTAFRVTYRYAAAA
jgi:hypothetical protein